MYARHQEVSIVIENGGRTKYLSHSTEPKTWYSLGLLGKCRHTLEKMYVLSFCLIPPLNFGAEFYTQLFSISL